MPKPYLTATEAIRRIVAVRGSWSRRGDQEARRVALIARLNHACQQRDQLAYMGKMVFHGQEFSGRAVRPASLSRCGDDQCACRQGSPCPKEDRN